MKESQLNYILSKNASPRPINERWKAIKYISTLTSSSPVFDFQKYVRGYEINLANGNNDECSVEYVTEPIPGFKVWDYEGLNPAITSEKQKTLTFIPLKFIISVSLIPLIDQKYNITLNLNGGTLSSQSLNDLSTGDIVDLTKYTPTHAPETDGTDIIFLGWSKKNSGILYKNSVKPKLISSIKIRYSDIDLYAIWSYDVDDDNIPDSDDSIVYTGTNVIDMAIADDAILHDDIAL